MFHFQQQTSLPLRVGIMLDTSSSIRQRFQFEQDSAITFLLQVLHRNDRAFVEGFDVQTDVEQGFTNNIDLLNQGIHKLRPGGGTALYDALYSTCKDQMLTLREYGAGAQGDRSGVGRRRQLQPRTGGGRDQGVPASGHDRVHDQHRREPDQGQGGDDALRKIAETTGGRPFFPVKIEDVALDFTASKRSCAASTCWSTGRRTSNRTGRSARSICRPTTRATTCARIRATSRPRLRSRAQCCSGWVGLGRVVWAGRGRGAVG